MREKINLESVGVYSKDVEHLFIRIEPKTDTGISSAPINWSPSAASPPSIFPTLREKVVTKQRFLQIYKGPRLNYMSPLQVDYFQTVVAGYTTLFAPENGADAKHWASSQVVTECKVNRQVLSYGRRHRYRLRRQLSSSRMFNTFKGTPVRRELIFDTAFLEVDFSVTFSSRVVDVLKDNYVDRFKDFMNSDEAKMRMLLNLQSLSVFVEETKAIGDLRIKVGGT